jgi:MerR family transcriptional regulator/heat shock protein HspR
MTAELGLNLAGVERVLDLEARLQELHARTEELEREALHAEVRLANELEDLRRSFRAELVVPYRGGTDIVRMADMRSLLRPPRPRSDTEKPRRRSDAS